MNNTIHDTKNHLIDELWGMNLPARFYESFHFESWGLKQEDYPELIDQYKEGYLEAWDDLLSKAKHRDEHGKMWTLHNCDGLWAVREDHDWEGDTNG